MKLKIKKILFYLMVLPLGIFIYLFRILHGLFLISIIPVLNIIEMLKQCVEDVFSIKEETRMFAADLFQDRLEKIATWIYWKVFTKEESDKLEKKNE